MPYIDVELEHADFRVILGFHDKPTNPRELPSNVTAIVAEVIYPQEEEFYAAITLPHSLEDIRKIIKYGRDKQLPIVAGDALADYSIVNREYRRTLTAQIDLYQNMSSKDQWLIRLASFILRRSSKALNPNDWAFRHLSQLSEPLISKGMSIVTLRDLTLAHRGWCFAEYQRSQGIKRPSIGITCGLFHYSVADKLTMDPTKRIISIKSHPQYSLYFTPSDLDRIAYTKYNPEREEWEGNVILDNRFAEANR